MEFFIHSKALNGVPRLGSTSARRCIRSLSIVGKLSGTCRVVDLLCLIPTPVNLLLCLTSPNCNANVLYLLLNDYVKLWTKSL